jgi:hypothetical protein
MGNILLNLIKFVLAVVFAPILYACLFVFRSQLHVYPQTFEEFFLWGAGAFVLSFLFIFRFENVYAAGQNIFAKVFQFAAPANQFIGLVIPFYTTSIIFLFVIVTSFLKSHQADHYFLFFMGFTAAMHLLLTAQKLHSEETTPFKPSYFFTMTVVAALNLLILVLLLDLSVGKLTFPSYISDVIKMSGKIYMATIDRLSHRF